VVLLHRPAMPLGTGVVVTHVTAAAGAAAAMRAVMFAR
jgi:hypothetical protein